jgi:hypothetical protein
MVGFGETPSPAEKESIGGTASGTLWVPNLPTEERPRTIKSALIVCN